MFIHETGLPHLLSPKSYFDPQWYEWECQKILRDSWHLVGYRAEVSRPGDFLTTEVLSTPIHIRNFDGEIRALSNVCAHRHSLINSQPRGHSTEMKCQYHGWCYGSDGFTRRIPCAKDFAPIDRASLQLPVYRLECIGQLLFICLSHSAPGLFDYLGPIGSLLADRCGDDHRLSLKLVAEYDANWKVAIENSLEAYHVESVHPNTFRSAPGESRSTHQLGDRHTVFETDMPFAAHSKLDRFFQSTESQMVRFLGGSVTRRYWQHHLFPNMLCSFTDAISLVHCVLPCGPERSRSIVMQFGWCPSKLDSIRKTLGRTWAWFEAWLIKVILKEDIRMYPRIQSGLRASPHQGCLARSEERIYAFQKYLIEQRSLSEASSESQKASSESSS